MTITELSVSEEDSGFIVGDVVALVGQAVETESDKPKAVNFWLFILMCALMLIIWVSCCVFLVRGMGASLRLGAGLSVVNERTLGWND